MIKSYELVHTETIITSVLRDEKSTQSKLLSLKDFKRERERFKKNN